MLAFSLVLLALSVLHVIRDTQPLFWDEYYHLLAARSWAREGTLAVGEGVYERAAWVSIAVGRLFRMFGDGILVARIAAGTVAASWGVILFCWVRRHAGRGSAWVAGVLFGISPLVLVNAGMIRFYGLVGVLLLISAMAVLRASAGPASQARIIGLALGAVLLLYLSYRITTLTRVYATGLAVWVLAAALFAAARSRFSRLVYAVVPLGLAAAVTVASWTGHLETIWVIYRRAPIWSESRAFEFRWYEGLVRRDYPVLWALFPVACVLAYRRAPRLVTLSATLFLAGMVLLSGAGPKSERYLVPILPYFFVIWGAAAAELWPVLRAWVREALERSSLRGLRRGAGIFALASILIFVAGTNGGLRSPVVIFRGGLTSYDRPPGSVAPSPAAWDEIAPLLREVKGDVDVVVTANPLPTLYHVGDYDYAMRPTVIFELSPPEEFTVDPRTGRPAIASLESLARVVGEHPSGLVYGEVWRWGNAVEGFGPEVEAFIVGSMDEVPLPQGSGVRAFRWGPDRGG